MKKKLILTFMMFFVMSVAHAEVNTQGLTTAQQAELTIQAEKMKEQVNAPVAEVQKVTSNVQAVSQWAEAGKSLAVGLGAGAKEIGVAVNEFADTRVGRITTYIIIWKLMGRELFGLFMGFTILFVLIPIVWKISRSLMSGVIEYEDHPFLWFTIRRKKRIRATDMNSDDTLILFITFGIIVILFSTAMHFLPY